MRTYKRKTRNGTISPKVMRQGRYTQKFSEEGGTNANDVTGVPLEKLISRYKTRRIFTAEEEKSLENYLIRASELHHGLSTKEVRTLTFNVAKKLEATSITRATAFNRPVVNAFFETYESLPRKYSVSACDVGNSDETGPTTV
ncbi:hypothetical protein QYM36_007423 [Artemia franciscana]|uniref:Uncharacterized protein n=1 Tax=Artemia franciscana TaxID=6661 RepID=A0AA88LCT1_ARTSF|nr:hypothetical protein QYM36_007423 [Artemia franciscana]